VTIYALVLMKEREGTFGEYPDTLAPGQQITVEFTTTISAEDAANGNLNNTVTVEGIAMLQPVDSGEESDIPVVFLNAENGNGAVATAVGGSATITCPFTPYVGIELEKTADKVAADEVVAGTVITYSFAVTNISDVALDDVIVNDPLPGLTWDAAYPDGFIGDMAVGETIIITATYTVTDADIDAGSVTNCAIADYEGKQSNESCVTVPVDQNPSLSLVKTAKPYKVKQAGDVITYTFVVTNNGGVTLHDVVIVDEMLEAAGVEIPVVGTLAPGETKVVKATYTVTEADLKLHKITNVAVATDGESVSNEDTATVKVYHPKPKPAPASEQPKPTPAAVNALPSTGTGDGAEGTGLWMIAVATALAFVSGGIAIRRNEQR